MTLLPDQRRTLIWLILGAAFVAGLWLLGPVLTPFLIGAVLAYALQPLVERLVRRRWPRLLAVVVVEIVFILLAISLLLLMVPILSKELPLLRDQIPVLFDQLNATITPWLAQLGIQVPLDIGSIKEALLKYMDANLEEGLLTVLNSARIGGSILLTVVGNLVLVPVVIFYLLLDWHNMVDLARSLVPRNLVTRFDSFFDECNAVLGQYLRGQLLVMMLLAIYFSVGLALFGFDLAVPVGIFTGLAFFIPYVGFGIGLVLALLAGILQFASWYGVITVVVVYGIGQVVESMYLTPHLVGERIGMNPLMVIFALLAFGQLFGFVGILVALPVSAVLVVVVRRTLKVYRASKLYQG
jgi:predicted PurR-regulated permease PerM